MAIQAFSKTGSKSTSKVTAPKSLFGEEIKSNDLLQQAYVTYEANARKRLAQVKTRSDVRGGGRKPWRQKGTGRARAGTIRSPLWRTGGVIFGPTTNRNYSRKLNRKSATKALKQALTLAEKDGRVAVIDSFDITDGKTKSANSVITNMGLERGVIIVADKPSDTTVRAVRNLQNAVLLSQQTLTAYDVLRAHNIVFTKDSLKNLEDRVKETT